MRKKVLQTIALVMIAAANHVSADTELGKKENSALPASGYEVTVAPPESLFLAPPALPDLSPYTVESAKAKIDKSKKGRVIVKRMLGEDSLDEFIGGEERIKEWVIRQQQMPLAIFIEEGYVTPKDIARVLPQHQFSTISEGVYLARLPIVVRSNATFHINKDVKEFRLSQQRGAFLVNDGMLFISDTLLAAWDETKNRIAKYDKHPEKFRPFLISWGGTETYILNSTIHSFGYAASKSYGVSISQYTPSLVKRMQRGHPGGWLIDSTFVDMWYGFYCYEAFDVVLRGNVYEDNIVYGIDPHDRSENLIIAENTAFGTIKKHGIIVSREVNNSWIFNNESYNNTLSGIVIDRSSVNNVVAYNNSYQNGSDGITIYESPDNLIWGNRSVANKRHGIRLRNSTNIRMYENEAIANGLLGIYGHIKDLTGTTRDIELDPFDKKVSMLLVGGKLVSNGTGPVSIDSPLSVELYQVDFLAPAKAAGIQLRGILGQFQSEILDIMFRQRQAVLIQPKNSQVNPLTGESYSTVLSNHGAKDNFLAGSIDVYRENGL